MVLLFAERVGEARRLRASGLGWREIGDLIGVAPDTARHYMGAHACRECGGPVLRSAAEPPAGIIPRFAGVATTIRRLCGRRQG